MATENSPTILALPTDVFSSITRYADPTTAYRLPKTSRIIRSAISKKDIKLSEFYYRYKRSQWDCFTWAIRHYHTDILAFQIPTANLAQLVALIDHACANHLPILDLVRLALQAGSLRLSWKWDEGTIWLGDVQISSLLEVPARHGDVALTSMFLDLGRGAASNIHGTFAPEHLGDALCKAAGGGYKAVVKLLLDAGADADEGIDRAAENGHIEVVEMLLDAGGDVDAAMESAIPNHFDLVVFLTGRGANINLALESAAGRGSIPIIRLMLEKGATSHITDVCGNSVASAIEFGSTEALEILLEAGGFLHTCSQCEGPLNLAAEFGRVEVLKVLLQLGWALIDGVDGTLYLASSMGYADVVELLLKAGAALEDVERCLPGAAANGRNDIVKLLLEAGADPRKVDVVEKAARYGHVEVLRLLVEAGADPSMIKDLALRQRVLRSVAQESFAEISQDK